MNNQYLMSILRTANMKKSKFAKEFGIGKMCKEENGHIKLMNRQKTSILY